MKTSWTKGKWDIVFAKALDDYWRENHFPPTLRDLMKGSGVTSTSVATYYLKRMVRFGLIRITRYGRPIPLWVDDLFDKEQHGEQKEKTKHLPQTSLGRVGGNNHDKDKVLQVQRNSNVAIRPQH
jgi:hypothetical protein